MMYPSDRIFTAEETRRFDEQTISEFGIDGFTLMELAAFQAAKAIMEREVPSNTCLALCGAGNNAGDALAVVRYLVQNGFTVDVHFVFGNGNLSPDTSKNLALLEKLREYSPDLRLRFVDGANPENYGFVLDGIFGTGISRSVDEAISNVMDAVNKNGCRVYAMDIPSGINGDSGKVMGNAIRADVTCMFGTRKAGCYFDQGPDHCGERLLMPLPFPTVFMEQKWPVSLASAHRINHHTEKKPAHKYQKGLVYVIAGSAGLTGAAVLAAKSAWATGCGYVKAIAPAGLLPSLEKNLIEQTKVPVGNKDEDCFTAEMLEKVLETVNEKPGVVLIGPGLGRKPETIAFVQGFLSGYSGSTVIDADALFALSTIGDGTIPSQKNWILTPHLGEFARLFGDIEMLPSNIEPLINENPIARGSTLFIKGFPGMIAVARGCLVTDFDTRVFTRAGFGDVLAGKIAGFQSMGHSAMDACVLAMRDGWQKARDWKGKHPFSPLDAV